VKTTPLTDKRGREWSLLHTEGVVLELQSAPWHASRDLDRAEPGAIPDTTQALRQWQPEVH
jgi:hypothetical protein